MLDLDEVRGEFSKFLAKDPSGKYRMDAALGHVALLCYQRGMDDALTIVHKQEKQNATSHDSSSARSDRFSDGDLPDKSPAPL